MMRFGYACLSATVRDVGTCREEKTEIAKDSYWELLNRNLNYREDKLQRFITKEAGMTTLKTGVLPCAGLEQ